MTCRQCSKNATIYKALNLEQKWNLTEMTNAKEVDDSIKQFKAANVTIQKVNVTNPTMNDLLTNLEQVLDPNVLNFTGLAHQISGSILAPDLRRFKADVSSLNNANLSDEV